MYFQRLFKAPIAPPQTLLQSPIFQQFINSGQNLNGAAKLSRKIARPSRRNDYILKTYSSSLTRTHAAPTTSDRRSAPASQRTAPSSSVVSAKRFLPSQPPPGPSFNLGNVAINLQPPFGLFDSAISTLCKAEHPP